MGRGMSKAGGKSFSNEAFADKGGTYAEREKEWDDYRSKFGAAFSAKDEQDLRGYVATGGSFTINRKLYEEREGDLSDSEKKTVDTMDRLISSHSTPNDGNYTRYCDGDAIKAILNLSNDQYDMLKQAPNMNKAELAQLNKTLSGLPASSKSFTSASTQKDHMFKSWYKFRREISAPKGAKAIAVDNMDEHEVIFGRNMKTVLDGISYDGTHIVLHEHYVK